MGNQKNRKNLLKKDINGNLIAKIPIGTGNPLGNIPVPKVPIFTIPEPIVKPELTPMNKFGLIPSSKLFKKEYLQTKVVIQEFIAAEPKMTMTQKNWFMKLLALQTSGIDKKIKKRTKKIYTDLTLINNTVGKSLCTKCEKHLCCTIDYDIKKEKQEYCFFFKNGCSIYAIRPIMCRNFLCDIITKKWLDEFCNKNGITLGIYDEKEIDKLKDKMTTLK